MKNKNSRLFHTGLYFESLRQLRLMGLIYLLIVLIFVALPPILGGTRGTYPVFAQSQAVALYFYTFIAPITMGYTVFGYLTRRNASDFYHALPVTREATFFSRAASIAAWMLITIAAAVLASFLANALVQQAQNWAHIPYLISYHFVSALLVLSCTLVGLSSSGTYFGSFVVTGILLFLPRMIFVLFALLIDDASSILYPETMGFLMDPNMNLPVALVAQIATGGMGNVSDPTAYIIHLPAHLYTLVLALVYLLIGCAVHNRRRSELARTAAPNRVLQHLYRCLIASPLFLVIFAVITADQWYGDWETLVVLAVIGLLVYFLYEIITTRRVRNLLGALYVLPILLAVCFALPWCGKLIGNIELQRYPDREQIQAVTLDSADRFDTSDDHYMIALSDYRYTDEAMLDLLYAAWGDTLESRSADGHRLEPIGVTQNYRSIRVEFHLNGGRTLTRRVDLTPERYNDLYLMRTQDEGFRSIMADLPDEDQITNLRISGWFIKEEDAGQNWQDFWATFREEYAQLSPEEQLVVRNYNDRVAYATSSEPIAMEYYDTQTVFEAQQSSRNFYDSFNRVYATGFEGLEVFDDNYRLTTLTPRSLISSMQIVNAQADTVGLFDTNLDYLQDLLNKDPGETYLHLHLRFYDPAGERTGTTSFNRHILSEYTEYDEDYLQEMSGKFGDPADLALLEDLKEILTILKNGSQDITDLDRPIVMLDSFNVESYSTGMGVGLPTCFVQLDEDDFTRFVQIAGKYTEDD